MPNLCFFRPIGSACHVVYSAAPGARIVDTLFFMLGCARCAFHKKPVGTRYAELVFLHMYVMIYGSRSAFRCVQGAKYCRTIFCAHAGPVRFPYKARRDTLHRTCVFASYGICGSRSTFWCIQGTKCDRTLFHARVGPV
jgi:hypothetical protein